jgi:hypothetical protein
MPVLALAQQAPEGTEISIRLISAVSTTASKAGEVVEAVAITPAAVRGLAIHGTIKEVSRPSKPGERAVLALAFEGARISSVDNARETVDQQGRIIGILAPETISGVLDGQLGTLGGQFSGLASVLGAAKSAIFEEASSDISYAPGAEMTLKLTRPLALGATAFPDPPPWPDPSTAAVKKIISREPFQTTAQNPAKPSDPVNVLLAGSEDALRRAFAEAGWTAAASLSTQSRLEVLRSIAEERGYSEAPVSLLLLEGKPPDLVFEKTNDTYAQRHHVRLWRVHGAMEGKPVWVGAAMHDIGLDFSETGHTVIHRIDRYVDREREKVADDLIFTRRARFCGVFARSKRTPSQIQNAMGDPIETDGRIVALLLD